MSEFLAQAAKNSGGSAPLQNGDSVNKLVETPVNAVQDEPLKCLSAGLSEDWESSFRPGTQVRWPGDIPGETVSDFPWRIQCRSRFASHL